MRQRTTIIGWPRRDPRHYRFAVSNEVWEYKLRPAEFVIFSYLYYWKAYDREEKVVSVKVVADSLWLTVATAEKHLTALIGKGLIAEGRTLSLECAAGKFFTLPNEVFLLALPASAFLVYVYLLYCENRRTHQCHPSYRTIAGATGLSLNTAVKSVGVLAERALIAVERSCWFNEVRMKRNGNNIYTIRPIREAVNHYNEQQLHCLEAVAERQRVQARLSRLCAPQEPPSITGQLTAPQQREAACWACAAVAGHERPWKYAKQQSKAEGRKRCRIKSLYRFPQSGQHSKDTAALR